MTARPDDGTVWRAAAAVVLTAYAVDAVHLERIEQGLVNLTVKVTARDGRCYVLQRLHPVFHASVNHNIAAVTAHLVRRRLATPVLIRTRAGAVAVETDDGIWRLLSFVEGRALDRLRSPAQARAAGRLLGKFHAALADFAGELIVERAPVHDFARHLARLEHVLAVRADHNLSAAVHHEATILHALRGGDIGSTTPRLVHGDPKISNMLFDAAGSEALCMIDLDTLARMPLVLELGDAFRSWCNPRGEDTADATFELALFEAGLAGYAASAREIVTAEEAAAIVQATLQIQLELAARFLADALEEAYFGWDAARYATRGEHNLARARGQLAAAASLQAQSDSARVIVARAFA